VFIATDRFSLKAAGLRRTGQCVNLAAVDIFKANQTHLNSAEANS